MNCLQKETDKKNCEFNNLVKTTREVVSNNERITLNVLIRLGIHEKNILHQLKHQQVSKVNDFEWQQYIRHYWEKDHCELRCFMSSMPYCEEYIGCKENLAITPLTDKAYMNLMNAFKVGMGASHLGPAGTGKTETMKDLARMAGQFLVIINTSDQLDYKVNEKILKGTAASGVWCCYDEFNRICVEVVSAFAEQFKMIREAREKRVCMLGGE